MTTRAMSGDRRPGHQWSIKRLPAGSDRAQPIKYQEESVELRSDIWQRGHIEPWELLRISAWK